MEMRPSLGGRERPQFHMVHTILAIVSTHTASQYRDLYRTACTNIRFTQHAVQTLQLTRERTQEQELACFHSCVYMSAKCLAQYRFKVNSVKLWGKSLGPLLKKLCVLKDIPNYLEGSYDVFTWAASVLRTLRVCRGAPCTLSRGP